MLNVVRVKGSEFSVTGEGIDAKVNWYSYTDSKVSGKGSRTNKDEIKRAVSNFIINEREAKKQSFLDKARAFKQLLTNINLFALYVVTVFFYDDQDEYNGTKEKLMTGAELLGSDNAINAELAEVKNTNFYRINSRFDSHIKRAAIAEKRYFVVLDYVYVTGLTLKEMAAEGHHFYDGLVECTPWEVERIYQAMNNTQTVKMLFTQESEEKKAEMAKRIKSEIERAKNSSEIVEYKEVKGSNKEGKEIRGAWFASKPCDIKDVNNIRYATYDNYVVSESVTLDRDTFELFALTLNMDLIGEKFEGGTDSTTGTEAHYNTEVYQWSDELMSIWWQGTYRECLEVKCNELEYSLIIDPQGYDYPRYVAIKGNYDNGIKDDTETVIFESVEIETTEETTQPEAQGTAPEAVVSNTEASYTINKEKNGIEIKFNEKPSANVIESLKENGFKWSSYGGIWWAKNTADRLKFAQMLTEAYNSIMQEEPETVEPAEVESVVSEPVEEVKAEQEESSYDFKVDTSYVYHNIHFKTWNMELDTIEEYLTVFEIPFYIACDKFICKGLTTEQVKMVEEINFANGAIIFYDDKYNEKQSNTNTPEQHETAENVTQPTEQPTNVIYHDFGKVEAQEEETQTDNMNMFDDFLSKFDNVEVTASEKVSAEDLEFCKEQEEIYNNLLETYNRFNIELQEISKLDAANRDKYKYNVNQYTHKHDTAYYHSWKPADVNTTIEKMKNRFINSVCYYFMKKYNVTIDYEKLQKKYDSNITYNNIIDEIYIQLDGFNFTEKAEQEIKENAKFTVRHDRMEVKNSKLIIDGRFAYLDSIWKCYTLNGEYEKIFRALQHYDNGSTSDNAELTQKYYGYHNQRNAENFERYEPTTLNKVKTIKFLKNGKLEIEFTSNQQATQFAREYCGFNQRTA